MQTSYWKFIRFPLLKTNAIFVYSIFGRLIKSFFIYSIKDIFIIYSSFQKFCFQNGLKCRYLSNVPLFRYITNIFINNISTVFFGNRRLLKKNPYRIPIYYFCPSLEYLVYDRNQGRPSLVAFLNERNIVYNIM